MAGGGLIGFFGAAVAESGRPAEAFLAATFVLYVMAVAAAFERRRDNG